MNKYEQRGRYFGYPECCIAFFVDSKSMDILEDINKRRDKEMPILYELFYNISHIPCPKCYATLLRSRKTLFKFFKITKVNKMKIDKEDEKKRICNSLTFIRTNVKANNTFISDREIKNRLKSLISRIKLL